jgi:hypothetical protein
LATDANRTGDRTVLLGEPGRTQVDLNFSLFGIPVRVHPFFWVIGVLLGPIDTELADILVRVPSGFARGSRFTGWEGWPPTTRPARTIPKDRGRCGRS